MSYSSKDCIEALIEASEEVGYSVKYEEYQSMEIYPTIPVMSRIFGSFNEAKKAAGLETRHGGSGGKDVNECYFKSIDSSEKAYWLGFIYGDGWISTEYEDRQDIFGVEIIDRKHLIKFHNAIESEHSISERNKKKNNTFRFHVQSDTLVDNLREHGVTENKTFTGTVPDIDEDYYVDFIRGLFDADGSASDGGWTIVGSSKSRLEEIQELLPTSSTVSENGDIFEVRASRQEISDWLYPEGNSTEPALERKRKQVRS
jgi:hypothetical protein